MYPSQDEAAVMAGLVGARTQSVAIPAYRYLDGNLAAAENRVRNAPRREGMARLLFVGGFAHQPNVDGIIWFCREIAPILRASGFSFQLDVVGSNANEGIMALGADDINVIGFVSDETLQALYEDADLVIAPLRFGAGVKGKVVEAMAYGVPVVTTDVGAQGIDPSGEILFLGNEPAAFARMVQAAAQRPAATDRALAAIAFVKEHYSQQAMSRTFESIFG
jgi:glycosyltransferase involved in cell wall biosynthesis